MADDLFCARCGFFEDATGKQCPTCGGPWSDPGAVDYQRAFNEGGVRQTSFAAFFSVPESDRAFRRKVVFEALLAGPANDRMLAHRTGMLINTVTPRRGELVELGLVVEDGRGPCPFSGRETLFWRASGVWR